MHISQVQTHTVMLVVADGKKWMILVLLLVLNGKAAGMHARADKGGSALSVAALSTPQLERRQRHFVACNVLVQAAIDRVLEQIAVDAVSQ